MTNLSDSAAITIPAFPATRETDDVGVGIGHAYARGNSTRRALLRSLSLASFDGEVLMTSHESSPAYVSCRHVTWTRQWCPRPGGAPAGQRFRVSSGLSSRNRDSISERDLREENTCSCHRISGLGRVVGRTRRPSMRGSARSSIFSTLLSIGFRQRKGDARMNRPQKIVTFIGISLAGLSALSYLLATEGEPTPEKGLMLALLVVLVVTGIGLRLFREW